MHRRNVHERSCAEAGATRVITLFRLPDLRSSGYIGPARFAARVILDGVGTSGHRSRALVSAPVGPQKSCSSFAPRPTRHASGDLSALKSSAKAHGARDPRSSFRRARIRSRPRPARFSHSEFFGLLMRRGEYGNVIVDVGAGESDRASVNEKIGAKLTVRTPYPRSTSKATCAANSVGPQIFLSRTAPNLMAELFKMDSAPKTHDWHSSRLKAVARDPGCVPRIAVISYDKLNRSGWCCVGCAAQPCSGCCERASGEKDSTLFRGTRTSQRSWSTRFSLAGSLPRLFWRRSRVKRSCCTQEEQNCRWRLPSWSKRAFSRRKLTGVTIDIMDEEQRSQRVRPSSNDAHQAFHDNLDLDQFFASFWFSKGSGNLEEVAYVEVGELRSSTGVDEDTAANCRAVGPDTVDRSAQQSGD